jgi:hypothetical protein
LILVACLAYASYRIHSILPGSTGERIELAKGLDVMVKDVINAGADEVRTLADETLRDPFRSGPKSSDAAKSPDVATGEPEADSLAGFVAGLSLDATFLQGKTQIAIINGRMYHQGEHLLVQNDGENTRSPLFVETVQAYRVTLKAENRSYDLAYPEKLGNRSSGERPANKASTDGSIAEIDPEGELAFYKKLLNSPLGKLGKSLTGNLAAGAPPGRAAKRAQRPRGNGAMGSP